MLISVQNKSAGPQFLDSQDATYEWYWKLVTADATPVALAPVTDVRLAVNTAYAFEGLVVARYAAASTAGIYRVQGGVKMGAAPANTAMVGTVGITAFEDTAGMDLGVTADTTNGRLILTATGVAATSINWIAKLRFIVVGATLP